MNWQHYWKAILGFLGLLATNIAYQLVDVGQPWPENAKGWGVMLLSTAAGTWLVYRGPANASKSTDS